jgi:hypothetical protein
MTRTAELTPAPPPATRSKKPSSHAPADSYALGYRPLVLPAHVDRWAYEEAMDRELWLFEHAPDRERLLELELTRCAEDVYYWARRYAFIEWKGAEGDMNSGRPARLIPNPAQIQYERSRTRWNIVLKGRKPGFSTWIDIRYLWRCIFYPHTHAVVMADRDENAEQLFQRVKLAYDRLPKWMRPRAKYSTRKELSFRDNHSHLRVLTAGSKNTGRGSDVDCLHLSEAAFYGDLKGIRAGVGSARRPGSWEDDESTANGFTEFRADYFKAKEGRIPYTAHFFPWWVDPTLRAPVVDPGLARLELDETEKILRSLRGLSLEQLQWRRQKREELGDRFLAEAPEDDVTCFRMSGSPKYDVVGLARLLPFVETRERPLDPRRYLPRDGSAQHLLAAADSLRLWVPPRRERKYVIGADVAEGVPGGHFSAAGGIDRTDRSRLDQVAELYGHWRPDHFGILLAELARWYNMALLAPERDNHGHACILAIRKIAGYHRLYRHKGLGQPKQQERRYGFPATLGTRTESLDMTGRFLTSGELIVRSPSFVREAMSFPSGAEDKNARDEFGGHWDRLSAWAIAIYAAMKGDAMVTS